MRWVGVSRTRQKKPVSIPNVDSLGSHLKRLYEVQLRTGTDHFDVIPNIRALTDTGNEDSLQIATVAHILWWLYAMFHAKESMHFFCFRVQQQNLIIFSRETFLTEILQSFSVF